MLTPLSDISTPLRIRRKQSAEARPKVSMFADSLLTARPLSSDQESEALAFLAERPIHTVFMAGLIRDNGLISPRNRGTFYGWRNWEGQLKGVTLIGHATFIETDSDPAMAAFARIAQGCPAAHLVLGEREKVARFWSYFSHFGQAPRRACRELLLELRGPIKSFKPVNGLRQAQPDDLDLLLPIYAEMIFEESGINPLEVDPQGFRQRWLYRINRGRVWIWTENGRLVFNTDIMSETPDVTYLEGVYVHPEERNKGYGLRCLSMLSRYLLQRTKSVCLFTNEENQQAQSFYDKAGFRLHSYYDTIFLNKKTNSPKPSTNC